MTERLAALVGFRNHLFEFGFAFFRVGNGFEFLAETKLDRALEIHWPELSGGPRDREHRQMKAAAHHPLRT